MSPGCPQIMLTMNWSCLEKRWVNFRKEKVNFVGRSKSCVFISVGRVSAVSSRASSKPVICYFWTRAVDTQIELIVGSENGKASSTDILNSADTLTTKKLKKSETEHVLNRLVHDKWLNEVKQIPKLILTSCVCFFLFFFLQTSSTFNMDTQLFRDTFVAFHMSWIIMYTVQSQPVLYRYISSVSLVFQLLMHISKDVQLCS